MGEVWIADDLKLNRRVALKLLSGDGVSRTDVKKRFTREARAAAGLTHPGICVIYEASEADDGTPFISMELLHGETLRDRIARGPLDPVTATNIGASIADGLRSAHAAGVLHRDIKPGNIMLTDDGRVKILDFGLARVHENPTDARDDTDLKTASGTVMGTPSYMSPEQAHGLVVDARSDIFSLGVVLFEMVTGKRPFDGATTAETLHHIIEAKPASARSVNVAVPSGVADVIAKCLHRDPEQRWTAAELADALRGNGEGRTAAALSPPSWRQRRVLVVAAVIVAAAVAGLIAFRRPATTPATAVSAAVAKAPVASTPLALAVLPFTTIEREPAAEYFADGVTEEIINALAGVRDLHVVSRTSSFAFKGARTDIREVGRRLNVAKVVEGSVRRAGDRVRVSVRLTNVADGVQLWSNTYDRDLKDIFALQDEISRSVADALSVRLRPGAESPRSIDPAIYLDYLKGRHLLSGMTEQDLKRAAAILEDVTRRAPDFGPAFASLADANLWLEHQGESNVDSNHAYDAGLEAAQKAIELDPSIGDGYAALAHALAHRGKMTEALAAADRAIELSPSSSTAAQWKLIPLMFFEDPRLEAEAMRAVALDPLSVQVQGFAGLVLMESGAYGKSVERLETATDLAPSSRWNLQMLAMAYAFDGRHDDAMRALDRAETNATPTGLRSIRAVRGMVLGIAGDPSARAVLSGIAMKDLPANVMKQLARGWAAVGETDRAIELLERMFRENPRYAAVNCHYPPHPAFRRMREDKRYHAMLAKAGLPVIGEKARQN